MDINHWPKRICGSNFRQRWRNFVIHITFLSLSLKILIHSTWEAQIASLVAKKITILIKYLDFVNLFSKKLAAELFKRSTINKHWTDLELGKHPPYKSIYNLRLVELKTFKIYIETNLANHFIRLSKSPSRAPILFIQKPDSSFNLCIDYWKLNNLVIKN